MTALHRNREASFTSLRDGLGLTDGNLGSHSEKLAQAGYIESRRVLTARGFEVRLRITPTGSRAFRAYVEALQALLEAPLAPVAPRVEEERVEKEQPPAPASASTD